MKVKDPPLAGFFSACCKGNLNRDVQVDLPGVKGNLTTSPYVSSYIH